MSCSSRLPTARHPVPIVVFADGFAGAVKEPGKRCVPAFRARCRAGRRALCLATTCTGASGASLSTADPKSKASRPRRSSAPTLRAPPPRRRRKEYTLTPGDAALPTPPGATKDEVALGGRIFRGEVAGGTCGGCHGSDGKGTPVGPDLDERQMALGGRQPRRRLPRPSPMACRSQRSTLARCRRSAARSSRKPI